MESPHYDGLLEPWKVKLIISRARRQGFRTHELPDILQELSLIIMQFEYDPEHAGGATESSALTSVIDHRLSHLWRTDARYQKRLEHFAQNVTEESPETVNACAVDIALVLAQLPERERLVCQALAQGYSTWQIARQLGCSWHTVERMIKQLRERFEAMGLTNWIMK